jgi:hypothetical protein
MFKHVARMQDTGVWTSKLGQGEDIDHDALGALEGSLYGTVGMILQRRLNGVSRWQIIVLTVKKWLE